ncbi:Fe-S cluster assembly protein SufD [Vulcanococcus sp. Clear-D1]|jgi:FeS assembly protein SufD|uniref:Fe-S cluster assembly protein SufD n=1 Tax=Vulcanococcus sp. Clear-D1 TaxID=2766970 RepID=UPI00198676E3|nr:Fe-S cluster assembly protein SufD [Vulcanococcus sp. Clear-D1]MBD1192833.1 Fe-S cluster assembly protein SufD [Vulcanococcus sp. Clear-D1]
MSASLATPAAAKGAWLDAWLAHLPAASGELAPVQERGRQALSQSSIPSGRHEDWRFTDLSLLQALPLAPAAAATATLPVPESGAVRLVWSGGSNPLAGQALPAGLQQLTPGEIAQGLGHTLAAAGCQEHWPVELNHAAAERVLALRVTSRSQVSLELVSAAAEGLQALRLLLLLEEKAELDLSQWIEAQASGLHSLVIEAHLARGARLSHGLVALGQSDAALMAHVVIEQEPESRVQLSSVTSGWGLARLEPRAVQVDGAAHTTLRGLQLVDGQRIADTHSFVEFKGPEGQLDQLHKAVAAGQGRSVFNGAVRVPRAAQRTNAAQLSRSLLLSDRARIDTKPELEIVADDVKCAHGATVSSLQTDELFYLQSRGIGADQAAGLLQRAFCEEVLRELPAAARSWCSLERLLESAA